MGRFLKESKPNLGKNFRNISSADFESDISCQLYIYYHTTNCAMPFKTLEIS